MTTYKLTDLEEQVLEAIKSDCEDGYSSGIEEITESTKLSVSTVKGVVGSLVKKGRVVAEAEERASRVYHDFFYVAENGGILSHGEYSE